MYSQPVPGLFGVARVASLIGCILVAMTSGTIYLYSAYSPQLGDRLHASNTQLNIIGYAAHVGNNISSPLLGRLVDTMGPRFPLIVAAICYFIGFGGVSYIYSAGAGTGTSLSWSLFLVLIVCNTLSGLGTSATISVAYNTAAKNFPTSMRARAVSFAAAGMGLSAFVFSTIARVLFAGDTSALLLLLTLATSLVSIVCLAVVRLIPLPREDEDKTSSNTRDETTIAVMQDAEVDCHTPLLRGLQNNDCDISASTATTQGSRRRSRSRSRGGFETDIHGKKLWGCPEFYAIALIMLALSGTGIMYINNVGAISRALYVHSYPDYDEVESFKWQSAQVSMISIGNFSGRLAIGFVADYIRTHFHVPRSYCLSIVSVLFIASQITAIGVSTVKTLWIASVMVGFAYGNLFGIAATIIAEWFGLAHMSENVGFVLLPLSIGGNILSFMFGQVLDSHTPGRESALPALSFEGMPAQNQCMLGRECYVASLWVSLLLSVVALGLSMWIGIRDGNGERRRKDTAVHVDDRDV